MIVLALYTAIYARLAADNTLVKYLDGPRIYDNYFSGEQQMPFVVIDFADSFSDDAFGSYQVETTVRVSLYASKQPADSTTSSQILMRLYGNVKDVPTNPIQTYYGLHQWAPGNTVPGWASAGGMVYRRTFTEHEETFYHWIQEYTIRSFHPFTADDTTPE